MLDRMKKEKRTKRPGGTANPGYAAAAQARRFSNASGLHRGNRPRSAVKRQAIAESRSL